jgi:hypothetical protein
MGIASIFRIYEKFKWAKCGEDACPMMHNFYLCGDYSGIQTTRHESFIWLAATVFSKWATVFSKCATGFNKSLA